MAPPAGKGKADKNAKPAVVYSDVNVCWKREKELAAAAAAAGPEQMDEDSKHNFLVQIQELDHRVTRLQHECDKLEVANEQFKNKYNQTLVDQADILAFLERLYVQKEPEFTAAKDELQRLKIAKQLQDEVQAKRLEEEQEKFQAMTDSFSSEITLLQAKMKTVKKLDDERLEVYAKISALTAELQDRTEKHIEYMYNENRKHNMECQYVRRQMSAKVHAVADECAEKERVRMIGVKRSAMLDTAQQYKIMAVTVGPRLTSLLQRQKQLQFTTGECHHLAGAFDSTTTMTQLKNMQQQKAMTGLVGRIKRLKTRVDQYKELYFIQMCEREAANKEYLVIHDELESNGEQLSKLATDINAITSELTSNKEQIKDIHITNWKIAQSMTRAAPALRKMLAHEGKDNFIRRLDEALEMFNSHDPSWPLKCRFRDPGLSQLLARPQAERPHILLKPEAPVPEFVTRGEEMSLQMCSSIRDK